LSPPSREHAREALLDWLLALRVTYAAMESTGVYWKPVWNILEGHVEARLGTLARGKELRKISLPWGGPRRRDKQS
jgi:hypothetical protein